MTESRPYDEHRKAIQIAREYRDKGYEVLITPSREQRPSFLGDFEPDLIARSQSDNVVIEIRSRGSYPRMGPLAPVVERINAEPGWRFVLVLTNREVPSSKKSLSTESIRRKLLAAREMLEHRDSDAATLLAWVAIEALLRSALEKPPSKKSQRRFPGDLAKAAYSRGIINSEQLSAIEIAFEIRNAVVHGYEPPQDSTRTARALLEIGAHLLVEITDDERSLTVSEPQSSQPWRQNGRHDVALSFVSVNRSHAEELAAILTGEGLRVVEEEIGTSAPPDEHLNTYFEMLFSDCARYCVIFVSSDYARRIRADEQESIALEEVFRKRREVILPVHLDKTMLPGLSLSGDYVDATNTTSRQLADLVIAKVSDPPQSLLDASAEWIKGGYSPDRVVPESRIDSLLVVSPEFAPSDQFAGFAVASLLSNRRITAASSWAQARSGSVLMAEILAKYTQLQDPRIRYQAAALLHGLREPARSHGVSLMRTEGDTFRLASVVESGAFSGALESDPKLDSELRSDLARDLNTILNAPLS